VAGLLPHQLAQRELRPEEVLRDPHFADANILVELLARYLAQTSEQEAGRRSSGVRPSPSPTPTPKNRARSQGGPIQANEPKRIANERARVLRELDEY
jgi:hypothetical protein